jgi:hypothetical protein
MAFEMNPWFADPPPPPQSDTDTTKADGSRKGPVVVPPK